MALSEPEDRAHPSSKFKSLGEDRPQMMAPSTVPTRSAPVAKSTKPRFSSKLINASRQSVAEANAVGPCASIVPPNAASVEVAAATLGQFLFATRDRPDDGEFSIVPPSLTSTSGGTSSSSS
jgi:hypothetical protein